MSQLIALLLVAALVICQNIEKDFGRHEVISQRLQSPYLDKDLALPFFDYGGNTFIRNDQFIRLTGDISDQRGWVISRTPSLPRNFQIEIDFKIHGQGNAMYGDGMAFWMINEKVSEVGPVLGFKDQVKGSAILIDTYKNNRPGKGFPYVMLMKNDGTATYDKEHDGLDNEIAGCSARGLHNPRNISKMRITYVSEGFLSLELNYKTRDKWDLCFEVPNFDLGNPVFIGFSGQTGELSEYHDIYRMQVYRLTDPPRSYAEVDYYMNGNSNAKINEPSLFKQSTSSWTWMGFFTKTFLLIFIAGGAYVGYTVYRAKNSGGRGRRADYLL